MRRSHINVLVAALGLCVGSLLTLLLRDPDRPQAPAAPGPRPAGIAMNESAEQMASRAIPALEGRRREASPSTGTSVAGKVLLNGRVVDDQGEAIPKALVYVLPKGVVGAHDPTSVPNVATEGDGTFQLELHELRGVWIGALASGRLPAWLDGDAIDASRRHELRLRWGGVVRIVARDKLGGLGTTAFVRIESEPRDAVSPLPAPGIAPFTVVTGTTENHGEVALRVGTTGPVLVRAVRWGYVSNPESVRLEEPAGEAVFEFVESCGLHVRVTDRLTRLPVTTWFHLHVTDARTGKLINGAAAANPFGEYELRDRLPAGDVDVRVTCKGYREWLQRGVRLTEPGRRHSLAVELEADPTVGDLVLSMPALAEAVKVTTGRPPPFPRVIWRRSLPSTAPWEFVNDLEAGVDPATYRLRGVPEGAYDLLICTVADRKVAVLREVRVLPGETVERPVELAAGRDVPLSIPQGELVARDVRVTAQDGRSLPCYRLVGATLTLYGADDELPANTAIGPYPRERIEVTSRTRGGGERTVGTDPEVVRPP